MFNTRLYEEGKSDTVAEVFLARLEDALSVLRIPEFLELEDLLRRENELTISCSGSLRLTRKIFTPSGNAGGDRGAAPTGSAGGH